MISEIRHIRAFLAVARHSSFTRAAQELHISQSALTVQVQQLEGAMGVRLLDRNKRSVALTDLGRMVLPQLERIVIDTEAVVSQTRDVTGLRRGVVAVAALPTVASGLFPQALKEFLRLHPGIQVKIHDVVSERVVESVIREEVDFGIGTLVRAHREVVATTITTDALTAYVPEEHPLATKKGVSLQQLVQYPLILTNRDTAVRAVLEGALRRAKLHVTPVYDSNYLSTAMGLVRMGFGVGILPVQYDGGAPIEGIKRVAILRPRLSRKIQILRKAERSPSHAAARLMQVVREVAAGQNQEPRHTRQRL